MKLIPISPDNWRLDLAVSAQQVGHVAPPERILARAYAYRQYQSQALVITVSDKPIGMLLYHDLPEAKAYDLSQFFIDQRYQGQGYGKEAMTLLLERLKREGRYEQVMLCYTKGNQAARNFYRHFGFEILPFQEDDEEIVMTLSLTART